METIINSNVDTQTTPPAKWDAVAKTVSWFFYSNWYFLSLIALTLLSWGTSFPYVTFVVFMLMLTAILVFMDDITPAIPIAFVIMFIFPVGAADNIPKYLPVLAACAPMIAAIGYHIWKYRHKFTLGKMFWPQVAVSIALLMGGLASDLAPSRYAFSISYILLLGPAVLIVYLLFKHFMDFSDMKRLKTYIAKTMTTAGIIITFELFIFMFTQGKPFFEVTHGEIDIGTMISNNIAMMMLLTAPFAFYLMLTDKKHDYFWFFIGTVQYATLFFTYSRGGIIAALITLPVILVYVFIKSEKKGRTAIYYGIVFVIAAIIFGVKFKSFMDVLSNMINSFNSTDISDISSNRSDLYAEAWEVFKKFPVFGAGMGYAGPNYTIDVIDFYWFHSTFFQIMGSLGLMGFLCYGWYYVAKFKIIFRFIRTNLFSAIIFLAFIGFEAYSMIDTGTFIPFPFMIEIILLTMIVEKENEDIVAHTVVGESQFIKPLTEPASNCNEKAA